MQQAPSRTDEESNKNLKENFSLLYEEYRNFIKGHIDKQPKTNKKKELKEKFEELSKRFQNTIDEVDPKKSRHKAQHVIQPVDEFILEEEEDHNTSRKEMYVEDYDHSLNELA
jgi:hypothetical protein